MTKTIQLEIDGMTCASCSAIIERMVGRMEGVKNISVNLAAEKALVTYDSGTTNENAICKRIQELGFSARILDARAKVKAQEEKSARENRAQKQSIRIFALALILTTTIMLLSMTPLGMDVVALLFKTKTHADTMLVTNVICFVLCIPVQFLCGARYYRGMMGALKARSANMDTLVALGTTIAFACATYLTFGPNSHVGAMAPFETSAMLITFVLLGKMLEARAKGNAGRAVEELIKLTPTSALVKVGESLVEKPTDELEVGDVCVVRPGERIPADGEVVAGASAVNESMLTGEPYPQEKVAGDSVSAGTYNENGSLDIKITRAGSDTTLAHIIELVEEAQTSKPPVQRLADKISAIFIPSVLVIALLTFFAWLFLSRDVERALMVAVSVIVVACPCALGLATPTATMVGTGRAAKAGILIKDATALEEANKLTCAIFDKTGTLTKGTPEIVKMQLAPNSSVDTDQAIALAAGLESKSEHPLAEALFQYATQKGITAATIHDFSATVGAGVSGQAEVHGKQLSVQFGNERIAKQVNKAAFSKADDQSTRMYLLVNSQTVAAFDAQDELKETSPAGIARLQAKGLRVGILSGDKRITNEALAQKLNISPEWVWADVLPQKKASIIKSLRKKGEHVCMVGDGINDAPALAEADVSISMGSGTDVALEVGNVVLMHNNPLDVSTAIALSKATMQKIKQNFFWALCYNCTLIPLAMAGIIVPEISGACMALSSVSVVTNSLLLRTKKIA